MMNAADMRDRTSLIIRPSANHYLPTLAHSTSWHCSLVAVTSRPFTWQLPSVWQPLTEAKVALLSAIAVVLFSVIAWCA